MLKKYFILAMMFFVALFLHAKTWSVGKTRNYTLPSQLKGIVTDGDTILIDGGIYENDATKWTNKNLVFIGLGKENNRTILRYTGNIPNGKGIFVFEIPGTCDNITIENIVFDGAQVSDSDGANGAGIRFQATNLTVKNCKFINCQNGILEGHGSVNSSNVILLGCEFENNGYQQPNNTTFSGYEHHIYISASADTLWVENCYFHRPRGQGNSIKTRAQRSYILYNWIDEENTGYGSWEINIAQGGENIILGNVIIQGSSGANHGIISYDAATNPLQDLYFVNNTVINKFAGNVRYFNTSPSSGINTFKIYNNLFVSIPNASITKFAVNIPSVIDTAKNIFSSDLQNFGFKNSNLNDYNLASNAVLAIDKSTNAGFTKSNFSLTPLKMYNNGLPLLPRMINGTTLDLGAFEYILNTDLSNINNSEEFLIYPNPSSGDLTIMFQKDDFSISEIILLDNKGVINKNLKVDTLSKNIEISSLSSGTYILLLRTNSGKILSKKVCVLK